MSAGAVRTWVLVFVVLAGAGLAGLVGIGCAVGANACPWRHAPRESSTDGRLLFLENCAICHGVAGRGSANAPALAGRDLGSVERIAQTIARGKPLAGMPAFRKWLTGAQIDALARYVGTL